MFIYPLIQFKKSSSLLDTKDKMVKMYRFHDDLEEHTLSLSPYIHTPVLQCYLVLKRLLNFASHLISHMLSNKSNSVVSSPHDATYAS